MDVEVRRADADEWRAVREIRLRALAGEPTAFGSTYAKEALFDELEWRQRITLSNSILAWSGEFPIGVVSGIVDRESGHHELVGMWVDLEHRGSAVATQLLAEILAWARRSNAREVALWVATENLRARRFYERAGFRGRGVFAPLPSYPHLSEEKLTMVFA